jgi:putative ABC transport system substrate-binding protein
VIDRRAFLGTLALAVLATPRLGQARPVALHRGVPRVGVLGEVNPVPWMVKTPVVDIECRWAGDRPDRLGELASELVTLDVDVIVALGAPAARAVSRRTARVPIVVVGDDDAGEDAGVARLARSGGNITWLSAPSEATMALERQRLLATVLPRLRRIAVLMNPDTVAGGGMASRSGPVIASSGKILSIPVRTVEEAEQAMCVMAREAVDGVLVPPDSPLATDAARLVGLVTSAGVPAVYGARAFAEAGGLMALYGDTGDVIRRTATVVRRILAGEAPAALSPPRLKPHLAVNVAAARRLGLELPPALLARADATTNSETSVPVMPAGEKGPAGPLSPAG